LYWGAGGADPFDPKTDRAIFNSSAGVRVFQWLQDMVYKYHGLPREAVSYDYEKTVDGVKSGTLAMAFAGTFRVVATRAAGRLGDNLQTAPMPGFNAGIPCVASTSGWVYCIGKDCKNPQAAWAYIEHAVSRESQVINARLGGELPSRRSTYTDPWFKSPEAAELVSWKDYIDKYGRALKYPERYLDAMENLADEAGAVILNNKPIQQALDDAAKKYNANL
jgi:multiple sugar transport system substrate-binding protein